MIATYYALLLTLSFARTMVLAESSEEDESCLALFDDAIIEKTCCDSVILVNNETESSKCNSPKDEEEWTCDDFKCLMKEDGILIGDKINDEKAKEMLDKWEKDYPNEKAMTDRVRRECLGGKYLEYIDDDNCEPLKFYTCLYINAILECQSWKKDSECTEIMENVKKCKEAQDNK